jgi:hypothetical protein
VAKDLLVAAVVKVASLSSSLAYEASIAKSPLPIPVACQVVDLQSDPPPHGRGCTGHHRWVIDPPTVALCLQTIGIGESFKAKVPNLAALEGYLKGAAFVCSRRHARLAAKCREGTFELSGPRRRLPDKVVLRRCMHCPRSCSLHFLHGGASSSLRYISAAPPRRSEVSRGFLYFACRKVVEAPSDCVGCRK